MPIKLPPFLSVRPLVAAALVLAFALPASAQLFDFDNVRLVARHDLYDGYNDVWGFVGTDGHEYVIQGTTGGTAWWDVEDPANAVLVKFIAGPSSTWRDMFVIDNHAYVGTEGGGGLQIVDISDPTDPTLVNTYSETVSRCHNIFGDVARKLIFTVGGFPSGGLQVLDASDPVNLVSIGSWPNQYIHDMSIEGTDAYLSLIRQNKFRIVDLTDPTSPVNVGVAFPDGSSHSCFPLGDGVHVALCQESNGGHLKIVDRSNPNSITLVAEDNPAPTTSAHNVHVNGDRIYVAWYVRGVRIYEASDPTDISEIGYFDTFPGQGGLFSGNWGVYPDLPSGLIVASDRTHGMFLLEYDPDVATLEGVISSSAGGGPLEGATVTFGAQMIETDSTGTYRFSAEAGTHAIDIFRFGFVPQTINPAVAEGATIVTNVTLIKLPSGGVEGIVTDAQTGDPLEGVEIAMLLTPFDAVTDSSGYYSFPDVPTSPTPQYDLQVLRSGYTNPGPLSTLLTTGSTITKDMKLQPAAVYEDFASPAGWTIQDDPGLSSGSWEFGEPKGTYQNGVPFQPEKDHTLDPEDQAVVTGNTAGAIGNDDVDGGATRLFSPQFDLSGMTEPHVFYYRWYAVSETEDEWQVHATTDGGSSWALIESTVESDPTWRGVDVDLTAITGSAPAVQFRFTAQDQGAGQVVEGALDDFALYDRAGPGAVGVAFPERRFGLELAQNTPNPFASRTSITFVIPKDQHVQLAVYDVSGRFVATLLDAPLPAGPHHTEWNGRTHQGTRAASGVYFYKLRTKHEIKTRKMTYVQ